YTSTVHLSLHSFPTRRSSDLSRNPERHRRKLPGSRRSASERNRCKANRCLGNNSVSWAESAMQKCVVYGEFIGKRNDSQEASLRSEEHTSELQSRGHLVCRLL